MISPKVVGKALDLAIRDLPGASVEVTPLKRGRLRAAIRLRGHSYRLEVMWAGEGWPSDVQVALAEIRRPWPRHLAVAARSFSTGAIKLLRELDANWLDESGNTRLIVPPGLAIVREPPALVVDKRTQKFRWSKSAIEVAEFVLQSNVHELKTGALKEETGWSLGQVSQILSAFEAMGWTERRGARSGQKTWHELVKPAALLDAWADEVSRAAYRKRLGHRTDRDLLRFAHTILEPRLGRAREDWALTTWAGLHMITPYATTTPILHVYVEAKRFARDLNKVMAEAQIREVDEGARIEFWEADFKLRIQRGKPHPLPIATTPRLYADLLRLGGRAADAAHHLRESVLGY